jgi:DNA primase
MIQSSDRPKWKHIGRKKSWVYPLYVNEETRASIEENQSVIFVESIGDMLNLHEHDHKNVLVTFGLDISSKLVCSTLSLNPQKIFISLNNDFSSSENRGLNASIKNYLKLLNYYNPDQISICLPNKKDFGEMTDEDFNSWKNKLLSTEPEKQRSFILNKINEIHKSLPKTLLKNKKIIDNE